MLERYINALVNNKRLYKRQSTSLKKIDEAELNQGGSQYEMPLSTWCKFKHKKELHTMKV
jgi:hypothetical protein